MSDPVALAERLATLAAGDAWPTTVLKIVRDLNLPHWAVGADAVRNLGRGHVSRDL